MMLNARSHAKRLTVGIAAAVVGFAAVGGGAAVAMGSPRAGDQAVIHPLPGTTNSEAPVWPTNAHGQTYGSVLNLTSSATYPDLVQAIATNGATGYVYSSQLNPAAPSSPAAAVAQQAANTTGQYIPVYAQNGTTVIGQFEVSEPHSQTQARP